MWLYVISIVQHTSLAKTTSFNPNPTPAYTHPSIQQVQEFFGDYMAVNPELFSLQLPDPLVLSIQR